MTTHLSTGIVLARRSCMTRQGKTRHSWICVHPLMRRSRSQDVTQHANTCPTCPTTIAYVYSAFAPCTSYLPPQVQLPTRSIESTQQWPCLSQEGATNTTLRSHSQHAFPMQVECHMPYIPPQVQVVVARATSGADEGTQ